MPQGECVKEHIPSSAEAGQHKMCDKQTDRQMTEK